MSQTVFVNKSDAQRLQRHAVKPVSPFATTSIGSVVKLSIDERQIRTGRLLDAATSDSDSKNRRLINTKLVSFISTVKTRTDYIKINLLKLVY